MGARRGPCVGSKYRLCEIDVGSEHCRTAREGSFTRSTEMSDDTAAAFMVRCVAKHPFSLFL